jgi:hypothetical protein
LVLISNCSSKQYKGVAIFGLFRYGDWGEAKITLEYAREIYQLNFNEDVSIPTMFHARALCSRWWPLIRRFVAFFQETRMSPKDGYEYFRKNLPGAQIKQMRAYWFGQRSVLLGLVSVGAWISADIDEELVGKSARQTSALRERFMNAGMFQLHADDRRWIRRKKRAA